MRCLFPATNKDAKTSSILLNQLLAFGAVANIGVVAALNTGVAQAVRDRVGMSISDLMQPTCFHFLAVLYTRSLDIGSLRL